MIVVSTEGPAGRTSAQEIKETARELIRRCPYPTVRSVSCECEQGMLFLRGRLSSFFHKQIAQETVAELGIVAQVVNEIEVAV